MLYSFFCWLLSLLKSLFVPSSPREQEHAYNIYKPEERTIYHYWNGSELISCDPVVLYKKIMAVGPELSIDMKVAASPMKDAPNAHNKMVEKLRKAFVVKSFVEGGLLEQQMVDLLDHFLIFCEVIKKNSNPTLTSPKETSPSTPALSPVPPTSSPEKQSPPIPPILASGSIEKDSTTKEQQKLPSEPELPSVV